MNGRTAGLLFLGVCLMLACLLLTHAITSTTSGLLFGFALVVLGGLSHGFRKRTGPAR